MVLVPQISRCIAAPPQSCLRVFYVWPRINYNAVGSPACMFGPTTSIYNGPASAFSPVDSFDGSAMGRSAAADIGGRATGKPAWNLLSDSMLDGSPA